MATALISHPDCRLHDTGPHHPERPQRLDAIFDALLASGVLDVLVQYDAPEVSREQLSRVHEAAYLDWLESLVPGEGLLAIDADTPIGPHTLPAARRAAGAAVLATDLVLGGRVANAFCNVRPPGHHALPGRAMGFCYYNNVAIGVAHALAAHGLQRVAVVDFDVHHGNGTDLIFADDARVLVCSVFEAGLYPFGDHQSHSGSGVQVPLPPGSGGEAMRQAVSETLLPALADFAPQMVFVSAGFDGHVDDPISDLCFTDADYAWLTREVLAMAQEQAGGRLVSTLEGGYTLDALARCASAHVRLLCGL